MDFEMSQHPKVSVIIPVFNNEAYLEETLNSLAVQTFPDFEALCVDDGSSDHSAKIVQEYEAKDGRFHYIFQENSGAGPARNHGMSKAKGEYIAFLDGDDLYYSDFLKRMVESLDKTQADVCICERESFDTNNGKTIYQRRKYKKFEECRSYDTQELVNGYYELMTVFCWDKMFRHSFLQEHSYEFQNLRHCNDVAFVCSTMAAARTVCFVKTILVRYRQGTGVSTQDKAAKNPLCAFEAFGKARENICLLREGERAWLKTVDTRCANAFFNTFQKNAIYGDACKMVYDAFKSRYEIEWRFREKPLRYFENIEVRLKMWCYRRVSYDAMRKIYLGMYRERGKRHGILNLAGSYAEMILSGLTKR